MQEIINELPETFDSHAFIKKFSKKFEQDYIDFLYRSPSKTFHAIHLQIGRFLSDYCTSLKINKDGDSNSENIFGYESKNQNWKKYSRLIV